MASQNSAPRFDELRRKRGISLEQIASTTKISTRFLRAIECEDFDALPGGVFDTNYIRQYAAALDLAPDRLLESYRASKAAQAAAQASEEPVRTRLRPRLLDILTSWIPILRSDP